MTAAEIAKVSARNRASRTHRLGDTVQDSRANHQAILCRIQSATAIPDCTVVFSVYPSSSSSSGVHFGLPSNRAYLIRSASLINRLRRPLDQIARVPSKLLHSTQESTCVKGNVFCMPNRIKVGRMLTGGIWSMVAARQ